MTKNDLIISKTDLKGRITYCNKYFISIGEYSEKELLGQEHNIIRHPSMPRAVFKILWDHLESKKEVFAFVLNKTKNGNKYWVFANVTPSYDENGKTIAYYSVRRAPNPDAIEMIQPIYEQMLEAEKHGDIEAGIEVLQNILNEQGVTYNEFIIYAQK